MTPQDLAALQDRAYKDMRPWSAADFKSTLAQPTTHLEHSAQGFLIAQVIPDEAEILALATDPHHQRQGAASALLERFESVMRNRGVTRLLLDVADGNAPAIAFYHAKGFETDGRRPAYYSLRDGKSADALLMSKSLT